MHKMFGKERVQGPIKRGSDLFFYSGGLKQVDCPPEPPGQKPGEVEAEAARNTRASANRGKEARRVESKRNQILATAVCGDIVSHHLSLARSLLGGRRLIPAMSIGNHRAVA